MEAQGGAPAPAASAHAAGSQPKRRSRQRRSGSRQVEPAQPGSGSGAGTGGGAAAAAAGGGAPGLTWQQQMLLDPAAPAFLPAAAREHQGPQEQGQGRVRRERPPRQGGRQAGRGGGRGRGRGGQGPPAYAEQEGPGAPQYFGEQQVQKQDGSTAPHEQRPYSGGGPDDPAQLQRQARPASRPRRRGSAAQLAEQGGSQRRQLELAASAAANRTQHRRQVAAAAADAEGTQQSSSSSDEAAAGASQQQCREAQRQRQRREPAQQQPSRHPGSSGAAADGPSLQGAADYAVPSSGEQEPEAPHCLICAEAMAEVGLGACNHRDVCGQCTLRLRLCYDRRDCPQCRQELREVIIAPWRPDLPPFEAYLANPEWVARSSRFARGEIWADRWRRGGRLSSRLMHDLQRRTALACCVCDPGGGAPFGRREHLLRHVAEDHGMRLCGLCLQEGRLFPLELEAFPSAEALAAHTEAAHPHCAFCRRTFYDDDALWKHMHQAHFSCHVCPPPVATHAYFNRAADLQRHMREEHYLCEEPECADTFAAFATPDELRRHHLERHSARMPRWDASRARPLQLDISYTRRGPAAAAADGDRRRQRRPRGTQDVRVLDGGGSGGDGAGTTTAAGPGEWPAEYEREAEGGLRIIDDAEFPSAAAAHPAGGAADFAAGGWAGRQRRSQQARGGGGGDEFPSLAAAAGPSAGAADGGGGGGGAASRPPPLVKKSAKCPCGRRVSHYAVQEGQEVPPLECDAVCRLEGRRAQLADAFGVGDPARHVSYFDSHKSATYSGLLLAAAQAHPKFIEGLERQLAAFVADPAAKRESLSAMPREQRAVVHALAQQYGLATTAFGQEPGRYIELFKTPSAGIPARLLSRVAPTVPPAEVAALLRESEGHPMRLADIAMSVDVRFYLRQWEGAYSLEWQGGEAAVVRFERAEDLQAALDVLGGGIRGLFRVDRSWRPKTAVAAVPAAPSGGAASSRGWGGASQPSSDGGAQDGTWTAVAVAPPAPRHEAASQAPAAEQQQQQQAGGGVTRWAVMAPRRRAASAPAPPAPAPVPTTRNLLAELATEHEDAFSPDHSSDSDA